MKISDHDMKEFEKLFAPVLDWLDVDVYKKYPENGFNMSQWFNQIGAKDFRGNDCVRSVCVLGYLWKYHGFHWSRGYGLAIIEDIIEKFDFEDETVVLDILHQISSVDDKNGERLVSDLQSIKPHQVAAAIRYFLKTRKIKWKKFLDENNILGNE